jgi:hypothetical protein
LGAVVALGNATLEQNSYEMTKTKASGVHRPMSLAKAANKSEGQPDFNVCGIAAKRRNKSNPWFKRGTLFRSAVDVMRRAGTPMTARAIADALVAGKAPQATHKQAKDLQAARYPGGAAEARRGNGGWRGQPGAVAVERHYQLRRP